MAADEARNGGREPVQVPKIDGETGSAGGADYRNRDAAFVPADAAFVPADVT